MAVVEWIVGLAARPQQLLERRRKQIADLRSAVIPLIGNTLAMMAEEAQIEHVRAIGPQAHDLAHGLHEGRPAIGRKPHDLVLVAVVGKSEKLCERLIEDAERMGKIDAPIDPNRGALANAPSSARKIAKSIDRNHHRPFKRRDMED